MDYLGLIEEILSGGLGKMSDTFRYHQLAWIKSIQNADGGFSGRQGPSDLYYTDFAVRCIVMMDKNNEMLDSAAVYLSNWRRDPVDYVELFNLLNLSRMLHSCGRMHETAFWRVPDILCPNAYDIFLNSLCREMAGDDIPLLTGKMDVEHSGQSSLMAATAGKRIMEESITEEEANQTANQLAVFQGDDGGFLAHRDAVGAELLSAFNVVLTLSILGKMSLVNVPRLARYIRGCAHADGGFGASPDDPERDIEYTYYGLGLLGLLMNYKSESMEKV
jgi:geranylgeranyl transferase type-2 subunit beta